MRFLATLSVRRVWDIDFSTAHIDSGIMEMNVHILPLLTSTVDTYHCKCWNNSSIISRISHQNKWRSVMNRIQDDDDFVYLVLLGFQQLNLLPKPFYFPLMEMLLKIYQMPEFTWIKIKKLLAYIRYFLYYFGN